MSNSDVPGRPEVSGVETYSPLPPDAPPELHAAARWYTEQAVLLLSTFKWSTLGAVVGFFTGLGVKLYLYLLNSLIGFSNHAASLGFYTFLMLPIILPLLTLIARTLSPHNADGEYVAEEGTDQVINAIHEESGRFQWTAIPLRLLLNLITLTFGGSTGKEGPAAQIGAGVSSPLADILHLSDEDRRRLVITGVAAGFAAVFGTPISGALFGVEVLYLGRIEYPVLLPCIVAGVVAQLTCGAPPPVTAMLHPAQVFGQLTPTDLTVLSLISGLFFGLMALLLIETMRQVDLFLSKYIRHPYWVAAGGGVALVALYGLFGPQYAALSYPVIMGALHGHLSSDPHALLHSLVGLALAACLVKIVATAITLKTGGVGGIVTPLFFIGATSGAAFATILHLPAQLFARFGFIALVAAAANTPIAAVVMGLEILGGPIGVYCALCACTAYLIVGHRSVFAGQRLGYSKAAGLLPTLDVPMGHIDRGSVRVVSGHVVERFGARTGGKSRNAQRPLEHHPSVDSNKVNSNIDSEGNLPEGD